MWLIIAFGVGVITGCVITTMVLRSRAIGYMRVDRSDPDDGPYLFLELKRDVSDICSKKYVTCEVKVENFISHK